MEKMISIDVICTNGRMFTIGSTVGSKVVDFKNLLACITCIPAKEQRLIYRGKILEDDQTLDSYGLQADHKIHLEEVWRDQFETTITLPSNTPRGGPGLLAMLYPAISQMMKSLLSDPQCMEQIIDQNPHLESVFDSNPQLKEMLQNPKVVRRLTSPQMMLQMKSLQQLLSDLNQQCSSCSYET